MDADICARTVELVEYRGVVTVERAVSSAEHTSRIPEKITMDRMIIPQNNNRYFHRTM